MSGHTLTVAWDTYLSYTVVCDEPPDAPCRAYYDCWCESWPHGGTNADGLPWHEVEGEVHVGEYRQVCNVREWIEMGGEDLLRGVINVPVRDEWSDSGLLLRIGQEAS